MRKLLPTMLLCLLALPAISQEKQASDNPLSAFTKRVYGFQKGILLRSAEKMPEEDYNFKPTETVRSDRQIIVHFPDTPYQVLSKAPGEKNPKPIVAHTPTSSAHP